MTENRRYVQVIYRGDFRMHKSLRLLNRYVQVDDDVADVFTWIVEIDILVNKHKLYNLVEIIYLVILIRVRNNIGSSNGRTE